MLLQIIDQEINPHVDQWEAEGTFPAHKIFKILGSAGFLGVNKPVGKSDRLLTSDRLVLANQQVQCVFSRAWWSAPYKNSLQFSSPIVVEFGLKLPHRSERWCLFLSLYLSQMCNWRAAHAWTGFISCDSEKEFRIFFLNQRQLQHILRV